MLEFDSNITCPLGIHIKPDRTQKMFAEFTAL
jgi:hypothetical protein